jgi:O-antigen ligase
MAAIVDWALLGLALLLSAFRPWMGVVAYYGFLYLQPKWNWAYSIPREAAFERYIIIAVLVGTLLRCRKIPNIHPVVKLAMLGLTVWISVALMGTYFAVDPPLANFLFGSLWKIALVAGFSCVAFIEPVRMLTLLRVSTVASLYSVYRLTKEYLELGYCRYVYDGWGWNVGSNQAAMIFTALAMLSLCLMLYDRKIHWRALAFLAFTLQMHAIMLLQSRSCMIGAVAAIGVIFFFAPKTQLNFSILVLGLIAGSVLAGPSVIEEFSSVFTGSDELDVSARSRFDTWKGGISAFQTSPIFGHGPNMSGYEVIKYIPEIYLDGGERRMKNPHNTPIEVLADYGIVGFSGYYCFFLLNMFLAYRYLRRKDTTNDERLALLAGLSGMIAVSLASVFSSSLLVEIYYMCGGLVAGAINYRYGLNRTQDLQAIEGELLDDEEEVNAKYWEDDLVPVPS